MKKIINTYLPKYSYIPLLSVLLINFITYYCSKIITNSFFHYQISSFIDDFLPFCPVFILFYILAYLQWIIGFIIISRESKEICYKFLSAEIIAKFCCLFFFFLFPTIMMRPVITGNSIWETMTKWVYFMDEPVNLFPSIHCLESWICFRGAMHLKKIPKCYKYIMFIFSIFVFLSTVLVKQHVFWDILGGILVVEIGIWFASHFHTGIIFERINFKVKQWFQRV